VLDDEPVYVPEVLLTSVLAVMALAVLAT